jgi:outer membrane protein assembly factor BamB
MAFGEQTVVNFAPEPISSLAERHPTAPLPAPSRSVCMKHFAALLVFCLAVSTSATDWPAWRGPHGDGASEQTGVPVRWSKTENIKWRTPLPGPGNSTPIVWNDRVFLTQATENGRRRSLICFDRESGKPRWEQTIVYEEKELTHNTNPHGASSPVTDGEIVVVWHGSAGLFAYDLDGQELWRVNLGKFEHIWGYASSPVLFENLVILNAGPGLRAFLVALDKRTGNEVWRRDVPEAVSETVEQYRGSWSTPVLSKEPQGRMTLLVSLPQRLHALDPKNGQEIWVCDGLGELVYTSPVAKDDIVVTMSGYHGPSMAVRTGGDGDVTATHRLWQHEERRLNPQRVGSGVIVGGHLYILHDSGIAWCMEIETGKIAWEQRLAPSWSSMCHVDGRLYVAAMNGTTFVVEPDPTECKVIAWNSLGEMTRASLAFSNGDVFIRTYEALYCIGERGTP